MVDPKAMTIGASPRNCKALDGTNHGLLGRDWTGAGQKESFCPFDGHVKSKPTSAAPSSGSDRMWYCRTVAGSKDLMGWFDGAFAPRRIRTFISALRWLSPCWHSPLLSVWPWRLFVLCSIGFPCRQLCAQALLLPSLNR